MVTNGGGPRVERKRARTPKKVARKSTTQNKYEIKWVWHSWNVEVKSNAKAVSSHDLKWAHLTRMNKVSSFHLKIVFAFCRSLAGPSRVCVRRSTFGVRLSVVAPSLPNVVVKPALGSSNIIFVSGKRVAWFSMCEIEYSKNLSRNLFQLRRCAFLWRIKVASSDISPKSFKHSVWLVQQYCELHFRAHQFHMPISAWIKWLFIYLL